MNTEKAGKLRHILSNHSQETALIAIILIVGLLVQIRTGGSFLTSSNLNELMRETSMLMMVSIGMMMVIVSGGIDLSVGSVMGLAGMIAALVLRDHRETPVFVLFLVAAGVGLISGVLTGFVVAKLRIFPLIGTLGTCDILRGVIYLFSKGEWVSQTDMTNEFLAISTGSFLGINYMVWFAIVTVIFGYIFMGHTRFGRRIYAVGNNEENAKISGINTEKTKWFAYIISGIIAGVAGLLWVCKYGCAQGTTANGFELNVIAAVVLGGVSITGGSGSVIGVVLGALLFGVLSNILPLIQVSPFWQRAIRGAVILLSVVINALVSRRAERKALERREQNERSK
ncbi:MAG: ABC transporter permease [Eubacteriales bacterium]|nr:ABC transporter permease [Eubacteriales bacterium]